MELAHASDSQSRQENPNPSLTTGAFGPVRVRVARILRDDLPVLLRFAQAAVYVAGPSGSPRLLASVGDPPRREPAELEAPNRLRAALHRAPKAATEAFKVHFGAADGESAGEALVVPLVPRGRPGPALGALVVYRTAPTWTPEEVAHTFETVRFILRALGGSGRLA
jgi:hypothetical protein